MRTVQLLCVLFLSCASSFRFINSLQGRKFGRPNSHQEHNVVSHGAVKQPQLLEFVEPRTNVSVVLIGSMHYNPTSIALTTNTINSLASAESLGSVIIESCPIRWNKSTSSSISTTSDVDMAADEETTDIFYYDENGQRQVLTNARSKSPSQQLLKPVLYNEMVAAFDVAQTYEVPVILGDQLINVTNNRCNAAVKSTIVDLLTPFNGGWLRLLSDVRSAADIALPVGSEYLGWQDFFDVNLLLAAPVTFVRYPLALMIKVPSSILPLLLTFFYPIYLPLIMSLLSSAQPATGGEEIAGLVNSVTELSSSSSFTLAGINLSDIAFTAAAYLLEIAVLSRVFLVSILAERNEVLAKNILLECTKLAAPATRPQHSSPKWWSTLFSQFDKSATVTSSRLSLAPKKVVAVLGMAHCNGIKKLLLSSDSDVLLSPEAETRRD